jgi:cell division protein FtsW (lipid II flippase)
MSIKARNFQHDLQIEFLKSLHDEKTKAQGQRATYIASKFAFISGLFGLGALKTDTVDFSWLLYFIPLVAIGYDLYIRAEDLSIKKMGSFLRNRPLTEISRIEKDWEYFSAQYRDKLAQLAITLITSFIILAAAVYIFVQQANNRSVLFLVFFGCWLLVSLISNWALWKSHQNQIKRLDDLSQQSFKVKTS